jgi:hypothetical protein
MRAFAIMEASMSIVFVERREPALTDDQSAPLYKTSGDKNKDKESHTPAEGG